jgi:hypothetical protein
MFLLPSPAKLMSSVWQGGAARLREMALGSLQQGDAMQVERSFAQLLELLPGDADALQFLASRHLVRGDAIRAVSLLFAAVQSAPGNAICCINWALPKWLPATYPGLCASCGML